MSNLEWVFLGTFISSLILLLSALTFLGFFLYNKRELKHISKKKEKGKSKRRAQKKKIKILTARKKKTILLFAICLFLGTLSGAASGYVSYYQSVNLSEKDSESVVSGYYLLSDFKQQLETIKKGDQDPKKTAENIQNLGGSMASFSGKRASELNKEEGQILLNRYYNIVKEIGVNASAQSQDFSENQELTEGFLKDVEKAKTYQKDVFKFYKVDEKSLKKEL